MSVEIRRLNAPQFSPDFSGLIRWANTLKGSVKSGTASLRSSIQTKLEAYELKQVSPLEELSGAIMMSLASALAENNALENFLQHDKRDPDTWKKSGIALKSAINPFFEITGVSSDNFRPRKKISNRFLRKLSGINDQTSVISSGISRIKDISGRVNDPRRFFLELKKGPPEVKKVIGLFLEYAARQAKLNHALVPDRQTQSALRHRNNKAAPNVILITAILAGLTACTPAPSQSGSGPDTQIQSCWTTDSGGNVIPPTQISPVPPPGFILEKLEESAQNKREKSIEATQTAQLENPEISPGPVEIMGEDFFNSTYRVDFYVLDAEDHIEENLHSETAFLVGAEYKTGRDGLIKPVWTFITSSHSDQLIAEKLSIGKNVTMGFYHERNTVKNDDGTLVYYGDEGTVTACKKIIQNDTVILELF